jgi:hypothetical protein
LWVSKIALFDKALDAALACGALAMCAMWESISKFCVVRKKLKHIRIGKSVGLFVCQFLFSYQV